MQQPRRSPYAPPTQDDDEQPRSMYDTLDNPGGDASDYEQPISGDQGGAAPLEDLGTGEDSAPAAPASGFASPYESAAPAAARPESDIAADATPATSKYETSPNVDWATQAPEAAGTDGFSTSPENRQPRSQEPISKYDIPKIGDSASEPPPQPQRSKAWQAVDDKKAQIDAIHKKLTGFGAAIAAVQSPSLIHMMQGEESSLRGEMRDLIGQAQYDDNRRGMVPHGKPFTVVEDGVPTMYQYLANGQKVKVGQAPLPAAAQAALIRNQRAKRLQSALKEGKVNDQGELEYLDPETGEPKIYQRPGKGSVLDTDNPDAPAPAPITPHFGGAAPKGEWSKETDDAGNVTAVNMQTKEVRKLGKIGKSKEQPVREDPVEKRASLAAESQQRAYEKDPDNPAWKRQGIQSGADAYAYGYKSAGGAKLALPGDFAQKYPPGTERPVMNNKTGKTQIWVSDGKKFVPKPSLVSSHGG